MAKEKLVNIDGQWMDNGKSKMQILYNLVTI